MPESLLFSPMQLRDIRLKNRIVLSPMLTYAAVDGELSDWHLMHLGKYAAGGAGVVFMESTKVDPRGCTTPADLGRWDDRFVPAIATACARFGPGRCCGHRGGVLPGAHAGPLEPWAYEV